MNNVYLIGRLGKDPECKALQTGNHVCNFSLATSEKYTDKEGVEKEKTDWHTIVVWGKLAQTVSKALKKGDEACVIGKVATRNYEKDGKKVYVTEIVASRVFKGIWHNEAKPAQQGSLAPETGAGENW